MAGLLSYHRAETLSKHVILIISNSPSANSQLCLQTNISHSLWVETNGSEHDWSWKQNLLWGIVSVGRYSLCWRQDGRVYCLSGPSLIILFLANDMTNGDMTFGKVLMPVSPPYYHHNCHHVKLLKNHLRVPTKYLFSFLLTKYVSVVPSAGQSSRSSLRQIWGNQISSTLWSSYSTELASRLRSRGLLLFPSVTRERSVSVDNWNIHGKYKYSIKSQNICADWRVL